MKIAAIAVAVFLVAINAAAWGAWYARRRPRHHNEEVPMLDPETLHRIDDVARATAALVTATADLEHAERKLADNVARDPDHSFDRSLARLEQQSQRTIRYIIAGRQCPPAPVPGRAVRAVFTIGHISGENLMYVAKATAPPVTLRVAFKDSEGNPAQVQGVPVWGQTDPALGTVTPAEDGMSATFDHGSPSSGQINVTADADLGEGVVPVIGVLDVQIVPGDASVAEISVEQNS